MAALLARGLPAARQTSGLVVNHAMLSTFRAEQLPAGSAGFRRVVVREPLLRRA
jgi:hypothetical protein